AVSTAISTVAFAFARRRASGSHTENPRIFRPTRVLISHAKFCLLRSCRKQSFSVRPNDTVPATPARQSCALATMAKQEAKRLSERVIAGMRKAAAKGTKSGKPIGRPRVDAKTERAIQRLLRGGTGINKTAATVGVRLRAADELGAAR